MKKHKNERQKSHTLMTSTTKPTVQRHTMTSTTSTTKPTVQRHTMTSTTSTTNPSVQRHTLMTSTTKPTVQRHTMTSTTSTTKPTVQRHTMTSTTSTTNPSVQRHTLMTSTTKPTVQRHTMTSTSKPTVQRHTMTSPTVQLIKYKELKGFRLYLNFINDKEEENMISFIDSEQWNGKGIEPNGELVRRTMQFGALFKYKSRRVESDIYPIPKHFDFLFERMKQFGIFNIERCNHIVVNEYEAGQGIMPHIDAPLIFGKTICALSMLSDCAMTFYDLNDNFIKKILLPRRSILVFEGESRYDMKHYISKDTVEYVDETVIYRERRVSLTCRTVIKIF
jgi:alkylated DNA repair dioxygenase AlkB